VVSNVMEDGAQFPGTVFTDVRRINGVNVGFIGLLDPKAIGALNLPKDIDIQDVVEAAARAMNVLRREKTDLVVALTHMDVDSDLRLAREIPGIHLILGGHDHLVINKQTSGPLLIKSGSNAQFMGKVTLKTGGGKPASAEGTHIEVTGAIPEDGAMVAMISRYERLLDENLSLAIGASEVELDAGSIHNRTGETNLGSFIAGVMRERMGADAAILNGGAIRPDKVYAPGPISKKDILSILPFGNTLCKIKVQGKTIKGALEHSMGAYGKGGFLQVAGLRVIADISRNPGARVMKVEINGKPLDPEKEYTLALNDYLLKGGNEYTMFGAAEVMVEPVYGEPLTLAVEEAIRGNGPISPMADGRMTILVGK